MPANVKLSPYFNQAQFTTGNTLLSGGKIYTFVNGTANQQVSYTDSSGNTYNSNPIILDSSGRLQGSIWLEANLTYTITVTTSSNVLVETRNNIVGGNISVNGYKQCPVFKDSVFYDNDGSVLSNGKIYTYKVNSYSVKQNSYTTNAGNVLNTNPIELNANGTIPSNIYLQANLLYNVVLTKNDGTTILKSYNGVYGI